MASSNSQLATDPYMHTRLTFAIGIQCKKLKWRKYSFQQEHKFIVYTFYNSLNIHKPNFSIACSVFILFFLLVSWKCTFIFHRIQKLWSQRKFQCKNGVFALLYLCKNDVCFQIICLFHLTKNKRRWKNTVRSGNTMLNTRLWRANMTFKIHICQNIK